MIYVTSGHNRQVQPSGTEGVILSNRIPLIVHGDIYWHNEQRAFVGVEGKLWSTTSLERRRWIRYHQYCFYLVSKPADLLAY
jgi:hypothetical protein